jgi:hypothetical protein
MTEWTEIEWTEDEWTPEAVASHDAWWNRVTRIKSSLDGLLADAKREYVQAIYEERRASQPLFGGEGEEDILRSDLRSDAAREKSYKARARVEQILFRLSLLSHVFPPACEWCGDKCGVLVPYFEYGKIMGICPVCSALFRV